MRHFLFLSVLSSGLGCGDTSLTKYGPECGDGTREEGGICVPIATDTGSTTAAGTTEGEDLQLHFRPPWTRTPKIEALVGTGTLEEKMYQRQILKDGLSSMLVKDQGDIEEGASVKETLSADQVRDLFNYKHDTLCDTLEMLKVPRCWPNIFGEANKENAGDVPEYVSMCLFH